MAPETSFTDPAVNYYVEDVDVAARFYIDNFGFVETFRTPKEGKPIHIEARLGTLTLGWASKESARTMHGLPLESLGSPRAELVLWSENVDKAYEGLAEKGVRCVTPPHDFLGTNRAAWVLDPDGNPIQIVSRLRTAE